MQKMKEVQQKNNRLKLENIDFLLFSAFMATFFLHYRINGFVFMLLIIFSVFKFFLKKNGFRGYKGLILFPILFAILILGQLNTEDLREGWKLIERNLALFFAPMVAFGFTKFSNFQKKITLHVFIIMGVLIGIICLTNASINALQSGSIYVIPNDTHFIYNTFMHHRLTDPVGLHAIYYSIYIAFINCYILNRLTSEKLKTNVKWSYGIIFLFFSILLYLLKSANVAFGFSMMVLLIIVFNYRKTVFKTVRSITLFSVFSIAVSFFAFKGIQTKLENFSFEYEMENEQLSPLGIRLSIWECSREVVRNNWLFGTGTGDSQNELVKVYEKNNFKIGLKEDFNVHNMFLQYWMSNGLAALLVFVGLFILLFKRAIKYRNIVFFSMLVLFLLFCLTESTMRTQKGMFFFAFFASIFYWVPTLGIAMSSEK